MSEECELFDCYEEVVELFLSVESKQGETWEREFKDNSVQTIFNKGGMRLCEFIEEFNKKVGMTQSLIVSADDAIAAPGHTEQFGDCCLPILTSFLGEGKVRLRSSS